MKKYCDFINLEYHTDAYERVVTFKDMHINVIVASERSQFYNYTFENCTIERIYFLGKIYRNAFKFKNTTVEKSYKKISTTAHYSKYFKFPKDAIQPENNLSLKSLMYFIDKNYSTKCVEYLNMCSI